MILSSSIASQFEAIINNACAAMMPVCAFPDRVDPETICIQTVDWPLSERKTSILPASLNLGDGDHSGGWQVQCKLLSKLMDRIADVRIVEVVPPSQGEDSVGAQWTVQDCYGYFSSMLEQAVPIGCRRPQGFGFSSSTVGGSPYESGGGSALAGTKFTVSIGKMA